MSTVGNKIKQLRTEKKVSLRKLSEIIHISHSFIADIESGRSNPSIDTIQAIADTFDVSVDYLLGRTEDRKPSMSLAFKQENQDEYEVKKRDDIFDGLSEEGRKELERYAKYLKLKDDIGE
jgi:transcriptional regulator with XRE-family HTH domain